MLGNNNFFNSYRLSPLSLGNVIDLSRRILIYYKAVLSWLNPGFFLFHTKMVLVRSYGHLT